MPRYSPEIELEAGDLAQRVTLLAPVYNQSEDEITAWNPVTDVWASVMPNFAQEVNEAGRTVEVIQTPIVIRYRTDIDARWRVQYGAHLFDIVGIVNFAMRGAQLQLNCKEVL